MESGGLEGRKSSGMREKQGESDEAQGRKILGGFCDRRKNGWPRMDPEVD